MDQEIKCVGKSKNCEGTFIFTEGEKKYFEERGLTPPKRCKPCRVEHRQWKEKNGHATPQRRRDVREAE